MYFLIDPSDNDIVSVRGWMDNKWVQASCPWKTQGSTLVAINDVLVKLGLKLKDVKGLAVLVGKGRFSATRAAVTTANTLAFALKIPVLGVTSLELTNLPALIEAQPVGQYILASYSGEARIGVKSYKVHKVIKL